MFSGIFIENGGGEFTPFLFLNAKNSETDQMLTTLVESLKEEKKVCKTVHNISDPQFYTTNGAHGLARLSS